MREGECGAWRRWASIDVGTVTCRMLVADVDEHGELHEVAREHRIVNLGEGVSSTRRLAPGAIERVACAVQDFLAVLAALPKRGCSSVEVRAVATSAARDAQNASALVERLAALGVELDVVPGEREASLTLAGIAVDFPGRALVVVDVGGGSTEVIAGAAARSFDVGCRRLTERMLFSDPPTAAEMARARTAVDAQLAPFLDQLAHQGLLAGELVAVAGTATSVVSVRDAMVVYDAARVHKTRVARADVDAVLERLAALPTRERAQVVGLEPARAPVIVAGLLILQEVMRLGRFDAFIVSESDILQGIILDAARA